MNFYTLTFKRKIYLSFLLLFSLMVTFDVALLFIADLKTTKENFIDDKFSKIKHFKLNNDSNKDVIFIGSSRTFYHISTNTMKRNGIDAYNLGISGAQFEDYPTLVNSVIEYKPKKIVISLSVERLYDDLNTPLFSTTKELELLYEINKVKFMESAFAWMLNRHAFLNYSDVIFYKLKSFYYSFDSKMIVKTQNNFPDSNNLNYSNLVGCKVFNKKQIEDKAILLKCENGDGVLIGNYLKEYETKSVTLKNLDEESITYLAKIVEGIKLNGIKPIIILEPILHNRYVYDLKKIKSAFNDEIIDLTNFTISDELWLDNEHLNYLGREKYSSFLAHLLK